MHQPLRLLHDHHRQRLGCDRGPRERPIRALSAPALRPSRRLLRRRPRPPAAAPLRPSSASTSERKRHSSVPERYRAMERLTGVMGARGDPEPAAALPRTPSPRRGARYEPSRNGPHASGTALPEPPEGAYDPYTSLCGHKQALTARYALEGSERCSPSGPPTGDSRQYSRT